MAEVRIVQRQTIDPSAQIDWSYDYMRQRYGSPHSLDHMQRNYGPRRLRVKLHLLDAWRSLRSALSEAIR